MSSKIGQALGLVCWICASTGFPPPSCTVMCMAVGGSGAASCRDACSYCIMGGSCQPQRPAADGTSIDGTTHPLAELFVRPQSLRQAAFEARAVVMEIVSWLHGVKRNCQGMIVERLVGNLHKDEIRLRAHRILV
jgi:hypothetical protein